MSYNAALNGLLVSYTVEILPYNIRAKGFIIFSFAIDLSLIFNQYVNPIALGKLAWKYYIFYCVFLVFELAFLWRYMIETKGKNGPLSLEEIAALFDGEGSEVHLANLARDNINGETRMENVDDKKGGDYEHVEESDVKDLRR
jgi:hypothetical protein